MESHWGLEQVGISVLWRAPFQGTPASFFYSPTHLLSLLSVSPAIHSPILPDRLYHFKCQLLCVLCCGDGEKNTSFHKCLKLNSSRGAVEELGEKGVPKTLNLQGLGGARGPSRQALGISMDLTALQGSSGKPEAYPYPIPTPAQSLA